MNYSSLPGYGDYATWPMGHSPYRDEYDDGLSIEEHRIKNMVAGFDPRDPDSLSEALGCSDLTYLARLVDYGQADATIALKAVREIAELSEAYWRDRAIKVLARKDDRK